jgi:hypothetical protein
MSDSEVTEMKDVIRTKKENVKLSVVMNPNFWNGLSIVNNNDDLPAKSTYWFGKAFNKISSLSEQFDKTRQKVILKYAELDAAGKPVVTEGNQVKFKDDAALAAFAKEISDLLEQEVEILKISKDALLKTDVKIKGSVLAAIDEMLF